MLFCGFSILISKAETLGEMMDMEEFTSSAFIHSAGPMPVNHNLGTDHTTWNLLSAFSQPAHTGIGCNPVASVVFECHGLCF